VGTLLRSAEAAGVHGVLFPTRRQAPLTPSAIKASAGAVEHLLLCPVDDLAGALADLHARGLRVAGAEEDAPLTARQTDLRGPLVIVVGSEGQGLGPAVRRRCDTFMRIPMRGAIGSLNAAVAGSILLFEAVAQRDPAGTGAPPRPAAPESVADTIDVPGAGPFAAEGDVAEQAAAVPAEPVPAEPEPVETAPKPRRRAAPKAAAPEPVPAEPEPVETAPKPRRRAAPKAAALEPAEAAPVSAESVPEPAPDSPAAAPKRRRKAEPGVAAGTPGDVDSGELLPGGPPPDGAATSPVKRGRRTPKPD
jgi:tRNA(Leu) C34 or U34 (ribose-2'-O)-methylase TrmL